METWIEITFADGHKERRALVPSQNTLGTSPSATLPVATVADLAPEHVMFVPRDDGCWVSVAQGVALKLVREGKPFEHGLVPWGTTLRLGTLSLEVHRGTQTARTDAIKPRTSPVAWIALVALPVAAWGLLSPPDAVPVPRTPEQAPPDLFAGLSPGPSCPVATDQAQFAAIRYAEEASRRAERYVFDPKEGVTAAHVYARARACYAAAQRGTDTERIGAAMDALTRRVTEDYRTRRLRLTVALKYDRTRDALDAARGLARLLDQEATRTHPYSRWIAELVQQLPLRIEEARP